MFVTPSDEQTHVPDVFRNSKFRNRFWNAFALSDIYQIEKQSMSSTNTMFLSVTELSLHFGICRFVLDPCPIVFTSVANFNHFAYSISTLLCFHRFSWYTQKRQRSHWSCKLILLLDFYVFASRLWGVSCLRYCTHNLWIFGVIRVLRVILAFSNLRHTWHHMPSFCFLFKPHI